MGLHVSVKDMTSGEVEARGDAGGDGGNWVGIV